MKNLLLEEVEYQTTKTHSGTWRRYVYPTGAYFAEYKSHRSMFGLPLVHYTRGICPETGTRVVAKGILAVGRIAVGGLAIGHASLGLVAIGQLGVGIVFGLGQASSGFLAIGQLAVGFGFGAGQLATGAVAIGQLALGQYVLAQVGFGEYIWTSETADPEAVEFFKTLPARVAAWWQSLQ